MIKYTIKIDTNIKIQTTKKKKQLEIKENEIKK